MRWISFAFWSFTDKMMILCFKVRNLKWRWKFFFFLTPPPPLYFIFYVTFLRSPLFAALTAAACSSFSLISSYSYIYILFFSLSYINFDFFFSYSTTPLKVIFLYNFSHQSNSIDNLFLVLFVCVIFFFNLIFR